jgi:hypothetical protein
LSVWLPGLLVVAAGLAAGFWMALRRAPDETADENPDGTNPAPSAAQPVSASRRAGLVGFLAGVASCLVVGALVYWATQGARPRPEMDVGTAPQPMAARPDGIDTAHDGTAELPPEVAAELARLRLAVEAAPQDTAARRQFTVALLQSNQLMEAFGQARELERLSPGDPDALFVEGVVRLAMGQWPVAIELMDRVLAGHPDHVLAALAKGQAESALGRTADAVATWRKGLAAAGGTFPPLEELLAQAEAAGGGQAEAPAVSAPALYRVRVELAPGATGPAGATLFLALRAAGGGPPAAVKRIPSPSFPLEATLGDEDSMLGQPLPARGELTVRLDGDGNATTQEAGDLAAAAPGVPGTPITLVLASAK